MSLDTKSCKSCNRPIVVMCQQGTGYCCQNHQDAATALAAKVLSIAGWERPPRVS